MYFNFKDFLYVARKKDEKAILIFMLMKKKTDTLTHTHTHTHTIQMET